MSAFLVVSAVVRSMDWVSDYVAAVPPIVRHHGGRFVAVSKVPPDAVRTMEGESKSDGVALITFPSMSELQSFLDDPSYAPYRRVRLEGTFSQAWAFENWDEAPQFIGQ